MKIDADNWAQDYNEKKKICTFIVAKKSTKNNNQRDTATENKYIDLFLI